MAEGVFPPLERRRPPSRKVRRDAVRGPRTLFDNLAAQWRNVRIADLQFSHRGDARLLLLALLGLTVVILLARSMLGGSGTAARRASGAADGDAEIPGVISSARPRSAERGGPRVSSPSRLPIRTPRSCEARPRFPDDGSA